MIESLSMRLAFFDVDQTLFKGYSNRAFVAHLTKVIRPDHPLSKIVLHKEQEFLDGKMDYNTAAEYFLQSTGELVKGLDPAMVTNLVKQLFLAP